MKRNQTQFRRKDDRDYRHNSGGTVSSGVNHSQQYKSRGKHKHDSYRGCHGDKTREKSSPQHDKAKKSTKKYCSHISHSKLPSSEQNETKDEIEIPGFYYDREKKRYFKIQPNHSNISSTVTRETITMKEKEEQRQKSLSDRSVPKLLFSHPPSPHRISTVCHLPALLNRLHTGLSTSEIMDKLFQQRRIVNLKNKPQCEKVPSLEYMTTLRPSYIENMQNILVGKNDSSVVGLWTEKESLRKTLKLLSIEKNERISEGMQEMTDLRVNVASESFLFYKVTNICWADIGDETHTRVLHTCMTYTGEMNSSAVIRNVDNFSDTHSFSLGNKCVWTCAWNPKGGNFSVGTEKNALLIDVNTRKMWELFTNKGDPLSQVFASKTSHCLYSGTRKNQIFCHDLRSISTRPVFCLSQSNSVCSLNTLQDEYKLLASDVNGKVCLWETRTRKVLVEYKGISNRYQMLPVHVDNAERVVYGVDQDGYTRFWCLKTGELLKCLPPPSALAHEYIPSVAYSEQWAGLRGSAGLLMGLGDHLYFYPSFQV